MIAAVCQPAFKGPLRSKKTDDPQNISPNKRNKRKGREREKSELVDQPVPEKIEQAQNRKLI